MYNYNSWCLCFFQYDVNRVKKVVTYWLAELIDKDTPIKMSNEHQAYHWLPIDKASEIAGYQDMRMLLEDCQKFIDSKQ